MNEDHAPEDMAPEDAAFSTATAGQAFAGLDLAPFTPARERAAQSMGMKAPCWSQQDFQMIAQGMPYPGALRDVTIFLWLSTIPNKSEVEDRQRAEMASARKEHRKPSMEDVPWTVQKADRNPEEAYEAACELADTLGVSVGTQAFQKAFALLVTKGTDIINSRFTIEGGGGGEADTPLGNG